VTRSELISRYWPHFAVRTRLAVKRWSRRTIFLAGGLAVGAVAVLMAWLADHAQDTFASLLRIAPHAGLLVTPLGFAAAVYLARHVFPNSQGSGIPQVIAALQI